MARRRIRSTPPILIDSEGRSVSRATRRFGFREKRMSYVPCLRLLLTMWVGRVTINILPDDVFLHIFFIDGYYHYEDPAVDFNVDFGEYRVGRLSWRWHRLVHVCSRWRSIVFASPNYLDLRLVCGPRTRMELTSIWPPLPIIITNTFHPYTPMPKDYDFNNAIVHPDRVREIRLFKLTRLQLQGLASATRMQEQFSALIHLLLACTSRSAMALPDGFLGVSAPRLQSLLLSSITFPALPKFLLSTTDLVRLILYNIPHSGYFSPETIVARLAVMPNLDYLGISFQSPLSCPHRENRRPPPPIRTVLPALTRIEFRGASEYLEDFVSRIDTPLVDFVDITFFHQLIFDIPQLAQFMGRSTRFQELKEAHVGFGYNSVYVKTHLPRLVIPKPSGLGISCKALDWQLSSLAQVLTSFYPSIYMVEHLYIHEPGPEVSQTEWQVDIENMQWLDIFHPFTAVKDLYLPKKFLPSIAPALQELVGGRTTEVLPILQNILLGELEPSELIQEGIREFVSDRQLSGQPITVSLWY